MKRPKILFVLTNHQELGDTNKATGFYLSEAARPWHVLTQEGYDVDFVSPQGGRPPVEGFDLSDPVNRQFWEDAAVEEQLENTLRPFEVKFEDYVAIHFVGGRGAMWDFPDNTALSRLAARIYENGGIISAICHGAAGLINIKTSDDRYLVDNKILTSSTDEEERDAGLDQAMPFLLESKLVERGARHIDGEKWMPNVQVDERLATGQNPASAKGLAEALARLLSGVPA